MKVTATFGPGKGLNPARSVLDHSSFDFRRPGFPDTFIGRIFDALESFACKLRAILFCSYNSSTPRDMERFDTPREPFYAPRVPATTGTAMRTHERLGTWRTAAQSPSWCVRTMAELWQSVFNTADRVRALMDAPGVRACDLGACGTDRLRSAVADTRTSISPRSN